MTVHPLAAPGRVRPEGASGRDPARLAAAVLAALRELMQLAPAVAAVRWAHEERATVISHLDRLTTQATVYRGQLLTAHKEDGRWARSGDRTFENHRGRMTAAGTGAARAEMELADGLAALPTAARAVGEEQFSLGHARELTRLRARAGDGVRRALEEHAEELVALARGVDAPAYGKRLGAWAAAIDAAAAESTFEAVRARRCLRLAERDGGGWLSAFLDPVAFAAVRTALEAHSAAPAPDDARTPEQRAADALTALADAALSSGTAKIGAQMRPHLSLLVPEKAWTAMRRRAAARPVGEPGTEAVGVEPGSSPLPELDDGTVLPLSELERLACDCELTRIVLDGDGIPVDVGRTERT